MTGKPRTCSLGTNLAAAAALMLDGDCGILPVLDDGQLVGVVTDRDMYIALATRNQRASELTVREVVQTPVYTCGPDDDVQAALETMKQHCVRRLPVEGFGGTIMGIVSINDIVLASGPRKPVRDAEVGSTLQPIWRILTLTRENARLADENHRLHQQYQDLLKSTDIWIRLYEAALDRANGIDAVPGLAAQPSNLVN
jgi:signal-transduction protein with cAMP-binding, CBS, and nucleotidyltransferase domain